MEDQGRREVAHNGKFGQIEQVAGLRRCQEEVQRGVAAGAAAHVLRADGGGRYRLSARNVALETGGHVGLLRALPLHPAAVPRHRQVRQLRRQDRVRTLDPDTDEVFQARKGYYRASTERALAEPAGAADEHHRRRAHRSTERRAVRRSVLQGRGARAAVPGHQPRACPAASRSRPPSTCCRARPPWRSASTSAACPASRCATCRRPAPTTSSERAGPGGVGNAVATVARVRQRRHPRRPLLPRPGTMIRGKVEDPSADDGQRRDRPPPRHRLPLAAVPPGPTARRSTPSSSRSCSRSSAPSRVRRHTSRAQPGRLRGLAEGATQRASWRDRRLAARRTRPPTRTRRPGRHRRPRRSGTSTGTRPRTRRQTAQALGQATLRPKPTRSKARDRLRTVPKEPSENRSQTNLLDRLLYKGVLPRYAFPTDVVSFHVFDRNKSTRFRTEFRYDAEPGPRRLHSASTPRARSCGSTTRSGRPVRSTPRCIRTASTRGATGGCTSSASVPLRQARPHKRSQPRRHGGLPGVRRRSGSSARQ